MSNIHDVEFLKTVRTQTVEKMNVPGLSKKWLAVYVALVAVIDRLLKLLTPETPQQ